MKDFESARELNASREKLEATLDGIMTANAEGTSIYATTLLPSLLKDLPNIYYKFYKQLMHTNDDLRKGGKAIIDMKEFIRNGWNTLSLYN